MYICRGIKPYIFIISASYGKSRKTGNCKITVFTKSAYQFCWAVVQDFHTTPGQRVSSSCIPSIFSELVSTVAHFAGGNGVSSPLTIFALQHCIPHHFIYAQCKCIIISQVRFTACRPALAWFYFIAPVGFMADQIYVC